MSHVYPHTLHTLALDTRPAIPETAVMGPTETHDRKVYNDLRFGFGPDLRATLPEPKTLRFRTGYSPNRRPGRLIHAEFIPGSMVADGVASIYISPTLDDQSAIALAVLREAIRASVYAECAAKEIDPPKRAKILQERLREFGIVRGGKVDESPEASPGLIERIRKILDMHGPRPHSAIPHDARTAPKGKVYDLKCECPDCGNVTRKTDAKLKQDWPTCSGSGTHRRVFMAVTDTAGAPIDIMSSGHVANVTSYVRNNADGTFSPAF